MNKTPATLEEWLAVQDSPNTEEYWELFTREIKDWERDFHVQAARARSLFVHQVLCAMERLSLSRTEFAKALGVKPSYITRALNEQENFTVTTMARFSAALGLRLDVHLAHPAAVYWWVDRTKPGSVVKTSGWTSCRIRSRLDKKEKTPKDEYTAVA